MSASLLPRPRPATSRLPRAGRLVYAFAIAEPLAIAGLKSLLPEAAAAAPFLLFFSGILLVAAVGGFLPGLIATATSAGLAAVLFLPPMGSVMPATGQDLGQVMLFALEGTFAAAVAAALRRALREAERGRERG